MADLGVDPAADPAVCAPPPGASPPRSISDAVDRVNALPKPLTLPCFLEALERPLILYASQSLFSAQPAVGRRSPRIFLFFADTLTMSIALDGPGRRLLEFGERRSDTTSVKGEIEFPVGAELEQRDAFEHLISNDSFTSCSACHDGEERDPSISFARAFVSRAMRPVPEERVDLGELRSELEVCDPDREPDRCAMLSALFSQGDVLDGEFPSTFQTFY